MAASGFTHSELAAKLVEGCLAHIAGNVQGKMPIMPEPATELERADVGLPQVGQTLFYPLGPESGVYVDLSGAVATVWFTSGDFDRALAAVEASMKQNHRVKQLQDEPSGEPKVRRREYEVECGSSRLAHVVIHYAERGARPERFRAHITALVRKQ